MGGWERLRGGPAGSEWGAGARPTLQQDAGSLVSRSFADSERETRLDSLGETPSLPHFANTTPATNNNKRHRRSSCRRRRRRRRRRACPPCRRRRCCPGKTMESETPAPVQLSSRACRILGSLV
ncbi:uncharacterized protein LOC111548860 [Piliocolobus tephrosceles]|uniref:uncharacterized protein LOC111548860 n=1 Tax=Piliocolobus tephrosceles TaxID=591936 RepID=UPI000C2B1C80|nr:uncharacterized protein LOC111548860 [Piliocolobus tephrosceles]